jgi:pyruvate/2-oxoglutarate/acetoin dehydrogenase E1 component
MKDIIKIGRTNFARTKPIVIIKGIFKGVDAHLIESETTHASFVEVSGFIVILPSDFVVYS